MFSSIALVGFLDVTCFINVDASVTVAPGVQVKGVTANGVDSFLGLPYATADRFEPPIAVEGFPNINATDFGAKCIQPTYGTNGTASTIGDEACLFLNVYRPSRRSGNTALSVFVWIHGGGFGLGAGGKGYDGASKIALEQAVVVVTLNYRLGPFGFFVGANNSGGNLGLMDQRQALLWVQQNIYLFGGDPSDVTLSGQSAGGSSVALHVAAAALPSAAPSIPLFQRIVIMSSFYAVSSLKDARKYSDVLLGRLGCSSKGKTCAKKATAASIVMATNPGAPALDYVGVYKKCYASPSLGSCKTLCSDMNQDASTTGLAFGPIADGKFLPLNPMSRFSEGVTASKLREVVVGTVKNEGPGVMLFQTSLPFDIQEWEKGLDEKQFQRKFLPHFGNMLSSFGVVTSADVFSKKDTRSDLASLYYSPVKEVKDWREVAFEVYQDAVYICPSLSFLDDASVLLPRSTKRYRFDHMRACKAEADQRATREVVREYIAHGSDLPLLFGDSSLDRLACPAGPNGTVSDSGVAFDTVDERVGKFQRRVLVHRGGSGATWPEWHNQNGFLRITSSGEMSVAHTSKMQRDRCNFWKTYWPKGKR